MQYFYDGQIRRYLTQVVRLLSNFVVRYGDGTLVRVPVIYGDQDRQAAAIINQGSENAIASAPRIAVYVSDFDIARDRLGDSTYVGKMNIRERLFNEDSGEYEYTQGNNYTVERLMPTPFDLSLKVDIWSTSTEQKLQILEQILVLFNPSLEIQTTDNYIDWTSLSVVELGDVTFSSRSVPVGTNSAIDIASLSLKTPVWLSPPVKVKKLGIITNIIANIYNNKSDPVLDYVDGLGTDYATGQVDPINKLFENRVSIGNFDIFVEETRILIRSNEASPGTWLNWEMIIKQFPGGKIHAGLSKIYLLQPDGTEVVGAVSPHPTDFTLLVASWDPDTFPHNTVIPGPVRAVGDQGYFDAIIDPTTFNPKRPNKERTDQPVPAGRRYLIVEGIGGAIRDTFIALSKTHSVHTNALHKKINDHVLYVNGIEVVSNPQSNPVFYNVISTAITGAGTGATFNVTQILQNSTFSAAVNNRGADYEVGDTIRVRGKKLGGANIVNDCIITVLDVNPSGGITSVRSIGNAIDKEFVIVSSTLINANDEVTYALNLNEDGPDAWKNLDGSDALAEANDIVEWDSSKWVVVFSSQETTDKLVYQMNFYTRTQYKWNGVEWVKSFEGEYKRGRWRIDL
jgi:hypothetical protein